MATEAVYDEAETFQTYSPGMYGCTGQPQRDIYSNSTELNLTAYCNSGDYLRNFGAGIQEPSKRPDMDDRNGDNISNKSSNTSGADCRDEGVEEMEADKEETNGNSSDVAWNVKLRDNWRRQLKRKAAANNKRYKKKDSQQTIGGSLSRFFGKASHRLSLPNLTNLSIFKSDSADVNSNEIALACTDDDDDDDDDDKDDCLWSDTEFDIEEPTENLYANINDFVLLGPRHDVIVEPEAAVPWSFDDASVTSSRHDNQHKTRAGHRQRNARLHDAGAKHKTDKEAEQATGDSSRANVRRKPPIAARPVGIKAKTASAVVTQRRLTCPPGTLDLTAIHADQQPSETAVRRGLEQADVDNIPRTDSRTSASSDVETGSGDSATSGFSSGGSDVSKATGSSDENATATVTLGRNFKRQKPPVKPKPRLNDDLITMTLNRRPMRPLSDNSSRPADSETQTAAPPVPLPRPFCQPVTNTVGTPDAAEGVNDNGDSDHERHENAQPADKDKSHAKKPLPPVKSAISRAFRWRRSQSVESVQQHADNEVVSPKAKTTTNNKEGTATTRQRGKAMMLDLTKLMHHRATGDLKPKPPRDKDRGTTSGAVPKLQAVKVTTPEPADVDHSPVATPLALMLPQLETQSWYFDATDKYICEQKVHAVGQDGAFVVRRRQADGDGSPYALTLAFDGQIYHMLIRRRDSGKFSLGTERPDQHVFNSVVELICFYANNPIHLTIDKDSGSLLGKVQLTSSPTR